MQRIPEITVEHLKKLKVEGADFYLLDVRRPNEFEEFNIGGHLISLDQLEQHLDEIPKDKLIIVHCRSGVRSATATRLLLANGFSNVKNLIGGVVAWQEMTA